MASMKAGPRCGVDTCESSCWDRAGVNAVQGIGMAVAACGRFHVRVGGARPASRPMQGCGGYLQIFRVERSWSQRHTRHGIVVPLAVYGCSCWEGIGQRQGPSSLDGGYPRIIGGDVWTQYCTRPRHRGVWMFVLGGDAGPRCVWSLLGFVLERLESMRYQALAFWWPLLCMHVGIVRGVASIKVPGNTHKALGCALSVLRGRRSQCRTRHWHVYYAC
jgi:hypothetical protein